MFWIVVAEIICTLPFQILQFEEKPVRYILLNVFKLALSFLLTIYFVKNLSLGIEGILFARLTGGAINSFNIAFVYCCSKADNQMGYFTFMAVN